MATLLCNITKEQIQAITAYFIAAKRLSDATELMNSVGRGGRGIVAGLNEASRLYDAAVRAAAAAFGDGT